MKVHAKTDPDLAIVYRGDEMARHKLHGVVAYDTETRIAEVYVYLNGEDGHGNKVIPMAFNQQGTAGMSVFTKLVDGYVLVHRKTGKIVESEEQLAEIRHHEKELPML